MDQDFNVIFLIPLVLLLIVIGIVLLFFKRYPGLNKSDDVVSYINALKISDKAKQVHLRELRKETPPKFTQAWFLEYWRGDRSVYYAWLMSISVLKILLG